MEKLVYISAFVLLIIGSFNCAYAYSDIDSMYWAYDAINEMSENNILSGYPDGTFKPESSITRAEFISILVHVIEPNADVSRSVGHWASESLRLIKERGILLEEEYSKFNLDTPISRREICFMIYRSFRDLESINIDKLDNRKEFLDVGKNELEQKVIAILSHIGVLSGYPDGTVRLYDSSTRAEVSCFINNFMKSRCKLISAINDSELIPYENGVYVQNIRELPSKLRKWENANDTPYATTIVKKIDIFPFSEPIERYKATFDVINNSENPYCQYRRRFGENAYVLAVDFETVNNTHEYEIYAGYEFLHVFFEKEDISIIDCFDTDEIDRQLAGDGSVGQLVKPGETWNTSAFIIIDTIPKEEIRFDRSITTVYDEEKKQNITTDSFHSLVVKLKEGTN